MRFVATRLLMDEIAEEYELQPVLARQVIEDLLSDIDQDFE